MFKKNDVPAPGAGTSYEQSHLNRYAAWRIVVRYRSEASSATMVRPADACGIDVTYVLFVCVKPEIDPPQIRNPLVLEYCRPWLLRTVQSTTPRAYVVL